MVTPIPTIVLAGAYCEPSLASEFGRLPPAFLPLGAMRLYEYQVRFILRLGSFPILTLPHGFAIDKEDSERLSNLGVRVVRTPTGLDLGQAILYVLDVLNAEGPVRLLHGDTLVDVELEGDIPEDFVAVRATTDYYNWADVISGPNGLELKSGYGSVGDAERRVACGYFGFSDAVQLREAIGGAGDFVDGLNAYSHKMPLQALGVKEWLDFGHSHLYYRSKRSLMVAREFNDVRAVGEVIEKRSADRQKMDAEAGWYEALPAALKPYSASYLGRLEHGGGYALEYHYLPSLAELFVFGRLPSYVWRSIMAECLKLLEQLASHEMPEHALGAREAFAQKVSSNLLRDKLRSRFTAYLEAEGLSYTDAVVLNGRSLGSLESLMRTLVAALPSTRPEHVRLWHGDFFFGNLLFDFRAFRPRALDPRGMIGNAELSVYGDFRYDMAKLMHSVVGGYDFVIANRFAFAEKGRLEFEMEAPQHPWVLDSQDFLLQRSLHKTRFSSPEILSMTASLFLSMLPLHKEDRQRQRKLLAIGLSLIEKLK